MRIFSVIFAALQISSINATYHDHFIVKHANVFHGFKVNGQTFGVVKNGKRQNLWNWEKIESIKFSVCKWHGLDVMSDVYFYTNRDRKFGPYGKCKKGKNADYAKFIAGPYSKRHVRLDRLKDQVKMTANKYAGNKYVKRFDEMPTPYVQNCNSGYSTCTKSCGGGGTQTCSNTCVFSSFGKVTECPNNRKTSSRACGQQACPVIEFSDWSAWTECDATCGGGNRRSTRTCKNGNVGQGACVGDTEVVQACNVHPCKDCGSTVITAGGSGTTINNLGTTLEDAFPDIPGSPLTDIDENPLTQWHSILASDASPQGIEIVLDSAQPIKGITLYVRSQESCPNDYKTCGQRYQGVQMLIDGNLVSKTSASLVTPTEKIEFMADSEKEICNDCENVKTGTRIKFIWTENYAQIARVDIAIENQCPDVPVGGTCDSNNGGCEQECRDGECIACSHDEYLHTSDSTCRSKKCEVDNGGCVNQQCNNGVCEDCAQDEYFNINDANCRPDPCDESACGGHQCSHNQGSVTCSCEDTSLIYDETKNDCIKNCAENNGGCVNQACNNGVCEDCAEGEYFNTAENSCKADPCDESACGGHQCSHNQGSVTCSCEDTSLIYDETKNDCIKNCAENNGGCDGEECRNGACIACLENEYFASDSTCKINPCSGIGVCQGKICQNDDGVAKCTEPTTCREEDGLQVGSDGITCTSISEAKRRCPSSKCWTWEQKNSSGPFKCELKTSCNTMLSCSPDTMDFRFNMADLIGDRLTNKITTDAACPIVSKGDSLWEDTIKIDGVNTAVRAGIDSQWKYDLGSCDSTVERSEDGTEILITKTIEYGGDNSGKTLSSARIFLDDAATTTIKFCCRFKATHTAGSDEIEIKNPALIEGKLETEGSWKESFSVKYTEPGFVTPRPDDYVGRLGEIFYVRVAWSVANKPVGSKLSWYLSECNVIDIGTDGNETGDKVSIINKVCYANVLHTKPKSSLISTANFDFEYKSFSFNTAGNGKQKLSCVINFCLNTETTCLDETKSANINCPNTSVYDWEKGSDL